MRTRQEDLPEVGRAAVPWWRGSVGLHRPQELHHGQVIGIRRGIVFRNVIVLLWGLQDERYSRSAPVAEQPLERLAADLSVTNQHVPVLVGAECALAVIQMKEGGRHTGGFLKLVEHPSEVPV